MQSFTCMCLLVPLLLFHLTQRSDTADHGGAATDVRSADRTLKRFLHDFRRAPKRRNHGRYDRNSKLSVHFDLQRLAEIYREGQMERFRASVEKMYEIGR
uniref:Conotoxin n=1 Tax=Conus betulinus TaxID=89764 RepID=A0A142C1A2_CONBE|nr:conotoxin [Conus betulinus]